MYRLHHLFLYYSLFSFWFLYPIVTTGRNIWIFNEMVLTFIIVLNNSLNIIRSRDSSVAEPWLTGWMIEGSSPGRRWVLVSSPLRPAGSGAHPASYPIGTRGSFHGPRRPRREADHSPLSSVEVKEWVEPCLHYFNMLSWRGAQLNA
jgi:hypothetical protein